MLPVILANTRDIAPTSLIQYYYSVTPAPNHIQGPHDKYITALPPEVHGRRGVGVERRQYTHPRTDGKVSKAAEPGQRYSIPRQRTLVIVSFLLAPR